MPVVKPGLGSSLPDKYPPCCPIAWLQNSVSSPFGLVCAVGLIWELHHMCSELTPGGSLVKATLPPSAVTAAPTFLIPSLSSNLISCSSYSHPRLDL